MIDIKKIGTTYTAVNKKGRQKNFYIVYLDTFLDMVGRYDDNHFPDFSEYMEDVVRVCSGFVDNPYQITWYAQTRDKSDITEALSQASNEGNTFIVIEYLPDNDLEWMS